jgi:transposase
MEAFVEVACGLDVHKESVVACVRRAHGPGKRATRQVQTFAAHLRGLKELSEWLTEQGVQVVAMEGTGVYWRPVYAVLEASHRWTMIVGNAQHIRNVPGRKTDVKDAEWLAELVAYGLIRPSFVPAPWQRELRDVVRLRSAWVADQTRNRNRILKILQLAGIKLDGVASSAFGKSGMSILRALAEGRATPGEMAQLALGVLRKKIDALAVSLESKLGEAHRQMLAIALDGLMAIDRQLSQYDALIDALVEPHAESMALLCTIPGVERVCAASILAELGPDMSAFASAHHAASWAGVCPGNHESAGKRSTGKTTHGNGRLKTMLCQAANAAVHTKNSYLRDKFYRLKARRGHGRAIMAIAHKILVASFHILKTRVAYRDLGPTYLDLRDKSRTVAGLVARIEALGFAVSLEPHALAPQLAPA